MAEVLSLGGQHYQPAEATTFAQDAHFMALLHETGIAAQIAEGGDIVAAVLGSGKVCDFLAAALVPLDGAWSVAFARATAQHFAQLTDRDEKAQLLAMLSQVITGFFGSAPPSAVPSPSSSETSPAPSPVPPRREKSRAKAASVSGTA